MLLAGCVGDEPVPPPLNLNLSESPDPSAEVYVVGQDGSRITSTDSNQWFYPVQKGLPQGTSYGFRLLRADGSMAAPVNENFTAQSPEKAVKELGVQQYQGFPVGNYVVELVEIQGDNGLVRARTNLTIHTAASLTGDAIAPIRENCSAFIAAAPYESRDAVNARSLYDCTRDLAIAIRDPNVCFGLNSFFTSDISVFWVTDCRTDYAMKVGDAAMCDESSMPKGRGFCRAMVANDSSECMRITCDFSCTVESIEDQQDLCILWYGTAKADNSVCPMVRNEKYREQCLSIVNE
jgi:hypothetical protein